MTLLVVESASAKSIGPIFCVKNRYTFKSFLRRFFTSAFNPRYKEIEFNLLLLLKNRDVFLCKSEIFSLWTAISLFEVLSNKGYMNSSLFIYVSLL